MQLISDSSITTIQVFIIEETSEILGNYYNLNESVGQVFFWHVNKKLK